MATVARNWERLVWAALRGHHGDHAVEGLLLAAAEVQEDDCQAARILAEHAYTLSQVLDPSSPGSGVLMFTAGVRSVMSQRNAKRDGRPMDRSQDVCRLQEFLKLYGERHGVYKFCEDETKWRVSDFIDDVDEETLQRKKNVLVTLRVIQSVTEASRRKLCPEDEAKIISKEVKSILSACQCNGDRRRLYGLDTIEYNILRSMLDDPSARPMRIPLNFLKAITSNFSVSRELGSGGHGVVYEGILQNGKSTAVKKLFNTHMFKDSQFQNEAVYPMGIKHENIVQFIGYCAESSWEAVLLDGRHVMAEVPKRLLCFEYQHNKSLDRHISDETHGLDWHARYEITKGICHGLHYLHEECNIVHLNLKPQNILLDYNMVPKIVDFGLPRLFDDQQSQITKRTGVESRGYIAPEYWNNGLISTKSDIFSLGVIIIELMTGCIDYPRSADEIEYFTEKVLTKWKYRFLNEPWGTFKLYSQQVKQCVEIGLNCVDADPNNRPTALHIIQMLSEAANT